MRDLAQFVLSAIATRDNPPLLHQRDPTPSPTCHNNDAGTGSAGVLSAEAHFTKSIGTAAVDAHAAAVIANAFSLGVDLDLHRRTPHSTETEI
jgi:hypothetical protein